MDLNKVKYFYYDSPIGILEIGTKEDVLVSICARGKVNNQELDCFQKDIKKQLDEYFGGLRKKFEIKFEFKGTDFQKKVWMELVKIPYGKTKSYIKIADSIGNKNAQRAVGTACNKNPILILIPCHRVISKNGNFAGFVCGDEAKKFLLGLENGN